MIDTGEKKRGFEYYCDNIENVENYEAAKKDNFKGWHCHHRLETHNSDEERRPVDLTAKELIALDTYYHRPAEELIFMPIAEHKRLHTKGKTFSEETKKKISAAKKGKPAWNKGKPSPNKGKKLSEEHKKKLSAALKGKPFSEETKRKMSEARKGKHWKLVDGKRVYY